MTHGNEKSSATKKIASSRLDPRRRGCERLLGESRFERLLNSWGTRCWSSVNFFSMVMLQLQSSILQDHIYPYSSIFVHIHPYSSIFIHIRPYSSIFIHIHPYSSIFIHIHPYSSIFVHIHPYSSIFIHIRPYSSIFIHIHPYSSIFIHIHPYSSIFIHIHPYSSIFIHIHPYSSIFIHIHPYSSIFIHIHPYSIFSHDDVFVLQLFIWRSHPGSPPWGENFSIHRGTQKHHRNWVALQIGQCQEQKEVYPLVN